MTPKTAQYKIALARCMEDLHAYPATKFAGFGIVICAGGPSLFTNAYILVHVLRKSLRCMLPIEIWHFGASEMSPRMLSMLQELDVRTVDASVELAKRGLCIMDGWQLKPFAMMWCNFQDALLLDADQVPTRDPSEMVEWPQYQKTGAVLWPDIVDLSESNPVWHACGLEPQAIPAIESGQLLINKARHWNSLQIAFHLNEHADFYYKMIYGDKETYLLGMLLAGSPFTLIPHRPITDRGLCLYQRDFSGEVLFQHRTGAKWRYAGRQDDLPGFVNEHACLEALKNLRRNWNGLIVHVDANSPKASEVQQKISRSILIFLVVGQAPLRLEMLPEGEIGEGRAPDRMNWYCEEKNETIHLVIRDAFMPHWYLVLQPNGHWYGHSVTDQDVQVFAILDGEEPSPKVTKNARGIRNSWPMPGRYSSDYKERL